MIIDLLVAGTFVAIYGATIQWLRLEDEALKDQKDNLKFFAHIRKRGLRIIIALIYTGITWGFLTTLLTELKGEWHLVT